MMSIAKKIAFRYGGSVVTEPQEAEKYLAPNQHLLFAIQLNDPKANYLLLEKWDLDALSEEVRRKCLSNRISPYANLLLILYQDQTGAIRFKLLNGMASRLVKEMAYFCDHSYLFFRDDFMKKPRKKVRVRIRREYKDSLKKDVVDLLDKFAEDLPGPMGMERSLRLQTLQKKVYTVLQIEKENQEFLEMNEKLLEKLHEPQDKYYRDDGGELETLFRKVERKNKIRRMQDV